MGNIQNRTARHEDSPSERRTPEAATLEWWAKLVPGERRLICGIMEMLRGAKRSQIAELARGYIKKLLENGRVVKFLKANHGDILSEFEGIVAADAI